jgi:short-subunit dehydrogenase
VAQTIAQRGRLDVAIANAGFGVVGRFDQLTLSDYRRQFETNVFGVLRTLLAALPEVRKQRGRLAVLGSVAGWIASPGTSPYTMSKFALRSLANAITPELALQGVRLTLISPGFVDSEIRRVDNEGVFQEAAPEPMPRWLLMNRHHAARQMLHAIARGRREVIITGHGKLLVALERFTPWIVRAVNSRLAAGRGAYRPEPKA